MRESFAALSRHEEKGLAGRSTACGRGAAVLTQMESPSRILTPLKRVGPRGAGRWEPIPFAQLVREVVEGGDLFGEGHVEGLHALRSMDPIDPAAPELGPQVNQVALLSSTDEGHENFARRFVQQAFGSINFVGRGAYCGGSYRSGSGAVFGDLRRMPHAKPDLHNAEFVIFCGTAPANAGNPFKRQGWQLAEGRRDGGLNYVVIDPVLGNSDSLAARDRGRWIPIRPASDGALAMAMMRWMIEHRRWNEAYLSRPSARAAQKAGEPSFTNATHLVVAEPGHPREGMFLRASDLGLPVEGERYGAKDGPVAVDPESGELRPAEAMEGPAVLLHDAVAEIGGRPVRLRSAADLLRESAFAHTLDEYAAICGIPAETIAGLAREFTSHGRKAAVNTHGGTMAGNGFGNAFALVTLNTLIGNLHWKGGTFQNGGAFPENGPGPRYDLARFDGMVQPRGLTLSRNNQPYERSSEFRRKHAAGRAYPAERPWYAASPQLASEWLLSALDGYPYPLKALFVWNANPVYGIPGLRAAADAALRDPKRLPLIVAIDPFINETGAYADYIVPDSLLYESWGWAGVCGPRYLLRLVELELLEREQRTTERRIRDARFPAVKSLESFDSAAIPSLNKLLVLELARCQYIAERENVIALGNSGTGRTHIALALGLTACQRGLSTLFVTAHALVHQLMEARDEKRLLRLQAQLQAVRLLIIDELGYVPLSQLGAELLFEVFSLRYERGSTMVTSNLPFEEWPPVFRSERLTGALLDRLTHHVHILELNGESYRLRQSKGRRPSAGAMAQIPAKPTSEADPS